MGPPIRPHLRHIFWIVKVFWKGKWQSLQQIFPRFQYTSHYTEHANQLHVVSVMWAPRAVIGRKMQWKATDIWGTPYYLLLETRSTWKQRNYRDIIRKIFRKAVNLAWSLQLPPIQRIKKSLFKQKCQILWVSKLS